MGALSTLRHAATRPLAWIAAAAIAALAIVSAPYVLPHGIHIGPAVRSRSVVAASPLLDRNAERPTASPRTGGPGGQVGDLP